MTEYSGQSKSEAKVDIVKVNESSLRQYIEKYYLPSILEISKFIPGIVNKPFGFLSIGYSVVPIDGDYSALDEKATVDFDENYNLITNNCGHYVMKFLATYYNGTLLSKDFFKNMSWNPVPSITRLATSVYRGFSIFWQDVQKWWGAIMN